MGATRSRARQPRQSRTDPPNGLDSRRIPARARNEVPPGNSFVTRRCASRGFGFTRPVDANGTVLDRAHNRRMELACPGDAVKNARLGMGLDSRNAPVCAVSCRRQAAA